MALLSSFSSVMAPKPCAYDSTSSAIYKVACAPKQSAILAVMFPGRVRKPLIPSSGLFSKDTALISERVICTDAEPRLRIELKYAKPPAKSFCEFMLTTPKQEVIAFFRDISAEIEGFRQLQDFHLKVRDVECEFHLEVYFNELHRGPELLPPYPDCIGCSMDTNLFVGQYPGIASKECILEEFSLRPYAVCRFDAKGRSGFSIMPVRHVEKMSELNDEELYAVWSIAARLLRRIGISFISLIMNHGSYRTLHHLNLKVWVDKEAHEKFKSALNDETKEIWYQLQRHAAKRPKKQQLCLFFKRDGWCRHGEYCSYLHGK